MTEDTILEKLNNALDKYKMGELILTRDLLLEIANDIDEYVASQVMWRVFLENMTSC